MKEILVLVGVSGSGKSTYAEELVKSNPDWVRLNYDSIRKMLVPGIYPGPDYYKRKDVKLLEDLVVFVADEILQTAFAANKKVVIDNTNLKQAYIGHWMYAIGGGTKEEDGIWKYKLFDVDKYVAKNRVVARDYLEVIPCGSPLLDSLRVVDYIDKQLQQYESIKKWLKEKWPQNEIV